MQTRAEYTTSFLHIYIYRNTARPRALTNAALFFFCLCSFLPSVLHAIFWTCSISKNQPPVLSSETVRSLSYLSSSLSASASSYLSLSLSLPCPSYRHRLGLFGFGVCPPIDVFCNCRHCSLLFFFSPLRCYHLSHVTTAIVTRVRAKQNVSGWIRWPSYCCRLTTLSRPRLTWANSNIRTSSQTSGSRAGAKLACNSAPCPGPFLRTHGRHGTQHLFAAKSIPGLSSPFFSLHIKGIGAAADATPCAHRTNNLCSHVLLLICPLSGPSFFYG